MLWLIRLWCSSQSPRGAVDLAGGTARGLLVVGGRPGRAVECCLGVLPQPGLAWEGGLFPPERAVCPEGLHGPRGDPRDSTSHCDS